jgi:hypothetical protein
MEAAEYAALLHAAMFSGRQLAGGVTHDLNSTLQCLGDALYAIREDIHVVQHGSPSNVVAHESLAESLQLADDAFRKMTDASRLMAGLVPRVADEDGPIHLGREIPGLVSLTWHHWRHRLEIETHVAADVVPFWCPWWVARLGVVRLVLIAIESQRTTSGSFSRAEPRPFRLVASMRNEWVEIRASFSADVETLERAATPDGAGSIDPVLTLCAKRLGGGVTMLVTPTGIETVFRFPVRSKPSPTTASGR